MKRKIIISSIAAAILIAQFFFFYYFAVPALNIENYGFVLWIFAMIGVVVSIVFVFLSDKLIEKSKSKGKYTYSVKKIRNGKTETIEKNIEDKYKTRNLFFAGISIPVVFILVVGIIVGIGSTPLFNAKRYAKQLEVDIGTNEEFANDFNFDGDLLLPVLDKELAFKAAQAKLSTYGSQYSIDEENFTIISVHRNGKDELIRVAPLEYSGLFVALNKNSEGSIGYIEVNVVTQETKLVEVDGGMKYMPSALFDKDLDRHIRFTYPTALFDNKYFEIDDEGKPYWVVPTYKKAISVWSGGTSTGCIIVDAVSGEIHKYKIGEEPTWVDRVVEQSLVEKQATNSLKYSNGFFNAVFGAKKDVFQVSDGYNYFIKNGQTYYVSCITSPNENDQTSVGFITVNLKTREAKKYFIPGITEMRAREIAMQHESVKAQQLEATWPILIDYKGVPTYFVMLKNDVQYCKFVLVNVENGTLMAMGDSLDETKSKYDKLINNSSVPSTDSVIEMDATVTRTQIFSNEIYFMIEEIDNQYFVVDSTVSLDAMFLKEGDKIHITYVKYSSYNSVKTLTRIA